VRGSGGSRRRCARNCRAGRGCGSRGGLFFFGLGFGFRFSRLFDRRGAGSRGSRSRSRRTRCRCLGRAVQRKLNHILDDGNFLIQQVNHQFKVNTADAPLIHDASRALGVDLDVFKFHKAAGVLDRHEATVEGINGIFVAAVSLESFQRGMNNFKLLPHRDAKGLSIIVFSANSKKCRSDHFNRSVGICGCRGFLLAGLLLCISLALGSIVMVAVAVLIGLGVKKFLRQRNGAACLGFLKLLDHGRNVERSG